MIGRILALKSKPLGSLSGTALTALLFGCLFWIGYDMQSDRLFASFPYHRLQTDAILAGHLSLSSSVEEIDHGLTWHNDQVNQVWGLGVALWNLPFELIFRLSGDSPCPDRIPLICLVVLVAWYVAHTGFVVSKQLNSMTAGILFVCGILFFPSMWNLILGRQAIFEQTILYACLISTAILSGLIRVLLLQRKNDIWFVSILGGLSALFRVTHGIYGLTAGLICVATALAPLAKRLLKGQQFRWATIAGALACGLPLLLGFLFLAFSNYSRFGSVLECGHRITNHWADIVFLTRFYNPFGSVSVIDASKELLAWIFLSPFHHPGSEWDQVVPFQAAGIRWRGTMQSTFDPSFLAISMTGCIGATIRLCGLIKRVRQKLPLELTPVQRLIAGVSVWVVTAFVGLSAFYLYAPIITSRYILDFTPSMMGCLVLVIALFGIQIPRAISVILATWLVIQAYFLWAPRDNGNQFFAVSRHELVGLPKAAGRKILSYDGIYSTHNHPTATKIEYNGLGWGTNGTALPIVTLMVDKPQFFELTVERRENDDYHAKIGNVALPLESIEHFQANKREMARVRFKIPENIRERNQSQVVYVCFRSKWEAEDRTSERLLLEVRWKHALRP
jgi:hypothetical protein